MNLWDTSQFIGSVVYKPNEQLNVWILPLVFNGLNVSVGIADYSRKPSLVIPLTSRFFDSLSYRSKKDKFDLYVNYPIIRRD